MKITFLGTSHGVPSASRYCSSALVECDDNVYLIDGGAPVADLLIRYGIPYEKLRGVFVTHMHSDHTFGLLHLCSLADWYFRQSSFDVFLPEDEGIDAFRRLLLVSDKSFDEERIRLKKSCSGVMYADGCLTVTAIPTRHLNDGFPSFAYLLEGEGKRVVFTGDLHGQDAADFPAPALQQPSDAIVCEMAHFSPEVIFPYVEQCPTKRFLFNHIYDSDGEAFRRIEALNDRLPIPVIAVSDGDVFQV